MEFIQCPGCGRELSSIFEYYTMSKDKILRNIHKDVISDYIKYDSQINESLMPVFEMLQIPVIAPCCRAVISTAVIHTRDSVVDDQL